MDVKSRVASPGYYSNEEWLLDDNMSGTSAMRQR